MLDTLKEQVVAVAKEAERWACAGTNRVISASMTRRRDMW